MNTQFSCYVVMLLSCYVPIFNKINDERTFFFLNLFSVNKKIIVGNTLRYLLRVDLYMRVISAGKCAMGAL